MVLNMIAQFRQYATRGRRIFRSFGKEFTDFRLMFAGYQRFRNRKCIMVLKSTAVNEKCTWYWNQPLQTSGLQEIEADCCSKKKTKEVGKIQRRPRRQVLNVRFPERALCVTKYKNIQKYSKEISTFADCPNVFQILVRFFNQYFMSELRCGPCGIWTKYDEISIFLKYCRNIQANCLNLQLDLKCL